MNRFIKLYIISHAIMHYSKHHASSRSSEIYISRSFVLSDGQALLVGGGARGVGGATHVGSNPKIRVR